MKLYFRPLACSLAIRIISEEAGFQIEFVEVGNGETTPEEDATLQQFGFDGHVPLLITDAGAAIHEGPAILQYLAETSKATNLLPAPGTVERAHVQQWLNFASAELHRGVFTPLMAQGVPEGARTYARSLLEPRFAHLERALEKGRSLLGTLTLADAYLLPILNWCEAAGVELSEWPRIDAYRTAMRQLPSVERAMKIEAALYFRQKR